MWWIIIGIVVVGFIFLAIKDKISEDRDSKKRAIENILNKAKKNNEDNDNNDED